MDSNNESHHDADL